MSKPKCYDHYYTEDAPVQSTQKGYEHRLICPGCRDEGHVQGEPEEVLDCKMVFIIKKPGSLIVRIGQCGCYSKEHGIRDRRD